MAIVQASIAIDGSKKRIYVVPPLSSYVVDGSGYRIYTPDDIPAASAILFLNVQRDIWSRMVDWWGASNDWLDFPIVRSGGAFTGYDELGNSLFATNNYTWDAEGGWRIVLPDYAHTTQFRGNLFSNNVDGIIYDNDRLTTIAVARLLGFDSLQTYQIDGNGSSGLTTEEHDKLLSVPTAEETADAVVNDLLY